jgi:hypothetical protein
MGIEKKIDIRRKCRVCGCTNDRACAGGCRWVGPDLCSQCKPLDPDLSVLPVPAEFVPPVEAWGRKIVEAVELATRDDARPLWHMHVGGLGYAPDVCAWCKEGVELLAKAPDAWNSERGAR